MRQLRFDKQLDAIMGSSICIPCDMPYVNNIWMPRRRADRPRPVPEGSTNLGLIGQYVEVEQDVAFTIEYSARTAWEAIRLLLKRGPRAAARLSGPVRSQGAVRCAEGCLFLVIAPGYSRRSDRFTVSRLRRTKGGPPCATNRPCHRNYHPASMVTVPQLFESDGAPDDTRLDFSPFRSSRTPRAKPNWLHWPLASPTRSSRRSRRP